MFDLDATKFLIVGAAALIFIPPKDLPRVMRQAGQFVGKMKRMASEFQGQFMDAMREADMADLRKEAHQLSQSTRVDLGLDLLNTKMTDALGNKPSPGYKPPPHDFMADSRPTEPSAGAAPLAPVLLEANGGDVVAATAEPKPEPAAHSA